MPGREKRSLALHRPAMHGLGQGGRAVDPNLMKPLQFRFCPPSMARQATKNNYRGILVMYAVVVTGGKQYRVMQGERLRVELLDLEAGKDVTFDQLLMLGDGEGVKLGEDLKGASVTAKVLGHGRADKIRIVKFRRRKHYKRQQGHRQHFTEIEITGINA
jgi:large subunit ribosomal protein L21